MHASSHNIIVTNSILAITPVSMGYGPGLGKPLENLLIFYANFRGWGIPCMFPHPINESLDYGYDDFR